MRIVVPIKQVPDVAEELELASDETDVEREFLSFVMSEFDGQALEEAVLLKEAAGGEVVVVALDEPDVDQALATALAKGADRAVKLTGGGEGWISSHSRAGVVAEWLRGENADLVLCGVQAVDDLDGQLPARLGPLLGRPHASVVVGVEVRDGVAAVQQDFGGGRVNELELRLPAVLGVQTASQPPRYVPISRIRQAMQEGTIEEQAATAAAAETGITVRRLYEPEQADQAEMLAGNADEVADRIVELIRARGL